MDHLKYAYQPPRTGGTMQLPRIAAVSWMVVILANTGNAKEGNRVGTICLHQGLSSLELELARHTWEVHGLRGNGAVEVGRQFFGQIGLARERIDKLDRRRVSVVVGVVDQDTTDDRRRVHLRRRQRDKHLGKGRIEQQPTVTPILVSQGLEVRYLLLELCARDCRLDVLKRRLQMLIGGLNVLIGGLDMRNGHFLAANAGFEIKEELSARGEVEVLDFFGEVKSNAGGVPQLPVFGRLTRGVGLMQGLLDDPLQLGTLAYIDHSGLAVDDDGEINLVGRFARIRHREKLLAVCGATILSLPSLSKVKRVDSRWVKMSKPSSRTSATLSMAITDLPRRVYSTPTGDLSNPAQAIHVLKELVPETGQPGPHLAILDLSGKMLSPASLRELIVPLGQQIRGGTYGELKLVVVASDPAVLEQIGLLAREHSLPLFLATSRDPAEVEEATPVGDLTPAEFETLDQLHGLGGVATVSGLAEAMDLEPSATNNRLVNVERKGYLHRIKRGRQQGDLFVDPRTRRQALIGAEKEPNGPRMREALLDEGIRSNPYDRSRLTLDGAAAKRAQEIIRRGSSKS